MFLLLGDDDFGGSFEMYGKIYFLKLSLQSWERTKNRIKELINFNYLNPWKVCLSASSSSNVSTSKKCSKCSSCKSSEELNKSSDKRDKYRFTPS